MTNHAAEPAGRRHANDAPPSFQQGTDASRPVRKASVIAGVALLLMSALAGFGYDFAIHGRITRGNAARTAQDIMAHQGLFRAGIACLFVVIALDVVAALALYWVFRPVSKLISAVAAGCALCTRGSSRWLSSSSSELPACWAAHPCRRPARPGCRPRRCLTSTGSLISGTPGSSCSVFTCS
jgi:hypothetical protein